MSTIFQNDESKFYCGEVNFTNKEVEELESLAPGASKVADSYVFQCEGIKEQFTINELVKGEVCYNYLSSGTYKVSIIQSVRDSNKTDTNFYPKTNVKKQSNYWYTLWIVSCCINVVFAVIFAVTIAAFYYKRYFHHEIAH